METHKKDIGAGLIDLPINKNLHLPKKIPSVRVLPSLSPEISQSSVRCPNRRRLAQPQSARHPPRQISHGGMAVLARASPQGSHIMEARTSTAKKNMPKWTRHAHAHVYMHTSVIDRYPLH